MNSSCPTIHLRAAHGKAPVCMRAGWHSRRNAGIAAGNGGVAVLK